jgi:hypothetical protein
MASNFEEGEQAGRRGESWKKKKNQQAEWKDSHGSSSLIYFQGFIFELEFQHRKNPSYS